MNYSAVNTPTVSFAVYLAFQGRLMAVGQQDPRSLEQLTVDEWGLPPGAVYFALRGKVLGPIRPLG